MKQCKVMRCEAVQGLAKPGKARCQARTVQASEVCYAKDMEGAGAECRIAVLWREALWQDTVGWGHVVWCCVAFYCEV